MKKIKKFSLVKPLLMVSFLAIAALSVRGVTSLKSLNNSSGDVLGATTYPITITSPANNYGYYLLSPGHDPVEMFYNWTDSIPNGPVKYQIEQNVAAYPSGRETLFGLWYNCRDVCTDRYCDKCFQDKSVWTGTYYGSAYDPPYADDYEMWRVNAKDSLGNIYHSDWSKIILLYSERRSTPSNAPVLLTPADTYIHVESPSKFDWQDVTGNLGYIIEFAKDSSFTQKVGTFTVNGSNYTHTSLPKGINLFWRVRTKLVNSQLSPWSIVYKFRVSNPPSIPVTTSPAANFVSQITKPVFKWNASTLNPTHYDIQIAPTLDFDLETTFGSGDIRVPVPATSWTDPNELLRGRSYYWRVRSSNSLDEMSAWSPAKKMGVAPVKPVQGVPTAGATLQVLKPKFTWTESYGATSTTIQVSKSTTMSLPVINKTLITAPTAPVTSYTPTTALVSKTVYYWRVKANSPGGSSAWSPVRKFTTK